MSSDNAAGDLAETPDGQTRPSGKGVASLATSIQMAVRNELRRDILNGTVAGSTRLLQADLAKHYGVSITPVREALRDLATAGLVDINPFSGATVHTPTLQELEDIYQVRIELLPLTVQTAVQNITDDELIQAKRLIALMDQSAHLDPWVDNNASFHHILEGACRNERLAGIMGQLADLSSVYVAMCERLTPRRGHANEVHKLILHAYEERDVDRAIQMSILHINDTLEDARDTFRQLRQAAKLSSGVVPAASRKRQVKS